MIKINKQKGSIALISILIISAILILLVLGSSEGNISTSYQYLNKESGKTSYYTAEACLEETIIRIEADTTFSGTTLAIGDTTCQSTVSNDTPKLVLINVNYGNYSENFQATVSVTTSGQANNATLLSWGKI